MTILLSRTAADTDGEPKQFLSPCGTAVTDADRAAYPGLHDNPDAYARAYFDVQRIIDVTTAEIAEWFQLGKLVPRGTTPDWTRKITAHFIAHDFIVPTRLNVDLGEDVPLHNVCCAGVADGNYSEIFISVRNPAIVESLIRWETGNCRLMQAGRTDWADRWHQMKPDPDYVPVTPKRRSAGRR